MIRKAKIGRRAFLVAPIVALIGASRFGRDLLTGGEVEVKPRRALDGDIITEHAWNSHTDAIEELDRRTRRLA